MDIPISRYQRGGDIYADLQSQYGTSAADSIAAAASTNDRTQLNAAIETVRHGPMTGSTSTLTNFLDQITTDPFAAPLDSLNNQVANLFKNLFSNPFALLFLVVAIVVMADTFFKTGILRRIISR